MSQTSPQPPSPTTEAPAPQRVSTNVIIWHMVRKYWPTALATMMTVVVAVTFYTLGQKKIYESETTVMFNPNPPRPLGSRVEQVVDLGSGNYWNNHEYYETEYKVIKSMRVANAVVRELGLHNDLRFLQDVPVDEEPVPSTKKPDEEIAARMLRRRLAVYPVKDSRLANVRLKGADPERTTRILATLIDTYIDQNLDRALESTNSASDWLRRQLDTLKTELETSERALHDYKKEKDILSMAFRDHSTMLGDQIKFLNSELTRVRADFQRMRARKAELSAIDASNPNKITSTDLLNNALLSSLRQQYEQAARDRDALLGAGKGKNHPEVLAAEQRLQRARKAVLTEVDNIRTALSREVRIVSRHAGGLAGMLKKAKKHALDLNLLEIEYRRLERTKDNTEKMYSLVLDRTKESDLARMLRVNNIRVLDRPLVPRVSVYPKIPLNIAAGLIVGLMLGIASAFLRGYFDRTLKVPDDIELELGTTFLGIVPQFNMSATGVSDPVLSKRRHRGRRAEQEVTGKPELIVHEQPTSSIAEASRAIRTNLIFMRPDRPYRTLLVTSPGPVEGKTTVACCIAVAMAQAGQRVLLLDCDLRRPRIHRIFGASSETGLTTALLGGSIEDIAIETDVPNMSIAPSGPIPPNPAEIFHSQRFTELLTEAKEKYDRVIIDSPPVAAVTDATILSTLVDGTVIVARAFGTRKELGRHAVRSIRDVGGNIAGGVLNAVDFDRAEYKYSYYYYRRDQYYRAASPPSSRSVTGAATASDDRSDETNAASQH